MIVKTTLRSATGILCFLAGILGVHRFYVGRWKSGLAMLSGTVFSIIVMMTAMRPGDSVPKELPVIPLVLYEIPMLIIFIVCIIDFFAIIFGKFKDKDGYEI